MNATSISQMIFGILVLLSAVILFAWNKPALISRLGIVLVIWIIFIAAALVLPVPIYLIWAALAVILLLAVGAWLEYKNSKTPVHPLTDKGRDALKEYNYKLK